MADYLKQMFEVLKELCLERMRRKEEQRQKKDLENRALVGKLNTLKEKAAER